jgi:beta-phosphoglucomutase-like phosphatase (HAD superfamily)
MKLQAVILDIDGTPVLSNDAHAQSWVEAIVNIVLNNKNKRADRPSRLTKGRWCRFDRII